MPNARPNATAFKLLHCSITFFVGANRNPPSSSTAMLIHIKIILHTYTFIQNLRTIIGSNTLISMTKENAYQ